MMNLLEKLLKMITNQKVLVVLAIVAVCGGIFLYMKSRKAIVVQSDVDQEITESAITITPETIEEETKDLGQSPMPMPAVEETTENFEVVGISSDVDNYAPIA